MEPRRSKRQAEHDATIAALTVAPQDISAAAQAAAEARLGPKTVHDVTVNFGNLDPSTLKKVKRHYNIRHAMKEEDLLREINREFIMSPDPNPEQVIETFLANIKGNSE